MFFLFSFTKLISQIYILAGGRYDQLASIMANKQIILPAIGFAAGVERLALNLELSKEINDSKIKIGLVNVN